MDSGADSGGIPLFQTAELHGSLGQGKAFHTTHREISREK